MSKVGVDVPQSGAKPPFTFRTTVAIALLAVNILVAAMYHHVINP
ncbi:photosystem I protein PsaX [Calothrix sp. NIES-3974]|nr:photosystem I protein PsaX [Calothrix sp. NIES-3974]